MVFLSCFQKIRYNIKFLIFTLVTELMLISLLFEFLNLFFVRMGVTARIRCRLKISFYIVEPFFIQRKDQTKRKAA